MPVQQKELCFFTVEMNRLPHLLTLPQNLADNKLNSTRFLIPDYNFDAYNFTGPPFDEFLPEKFSKHPRTVISALSNTHQAVVNEISYSQLLFEFYVRYQYYGTAAHFKIPA